MNYHYKKIYKKQMISIITMMVNYMYIISMGYCKKDITPLLSHWSYVFLALTHQHKEAHQQNIKYVWNTMH